MDDKLKRSRAKDSIHQPNEGKGNKTAARQYNDAQRQSARSGKVDRQARAADKALDSAERGQLEHAELVGSRHADDEGPAVKKR